MNPFTAPGNEPPSKVSRTCPFLLTHQQEKGPWATGAGGYWKSDSWLQIPVQAHSTDIPYTTCPRRSVFICRASSSALLHEEKGQSLAQPSTFPTADRDWPGRCSVMQAGPWSPRWNKGGSCPQGAHSPVRVTDAQQPRAVQQSLCSESGAPSIQNRVQLTLLGVWWGWGVRARKVSQRSPQALGLMCCADLGRWRGRKGCATGDFREG